MPDLDTQAASSTPAAVPVGGVPAPEGPAEAQLTVPSAWTHNLGWHVFRNTASQVVGRNVIALGRLVVASLIVRAYGRSVFGEYSLLFTLLVIGEWMLDFGTTETFVREICREPAQAARLLRTVAAAKFVQIPFAVAVVSAALFAMHYPWRVVEAGLIGAVELLFFSGVLVYRIIFKASLTMDREVGAELVSVMVMIPLVWFAAHHGGGLNSLLACYAASRAVFLAACWRLGRKQFAMSLRGVVLADVRWSLHLSAAIGFIGLIVVVNETMDILVLSRFGGISAVALYSGAQRFTAPLLTALASIGATLYPVAASYWPQSKDRFDAACQQGLNSALTIAGLAIVVLLAAPGFFMGLLGPALAAGAPVLMVLALLCFLKAMSSALGPVLYVIRAQKEVLKVVAVAVIGKGLVLSLLASRFGYMGVAFGAMGVELCFTVGPMMYLLYTHCGYRIRWAVPAKVVGVTLAAAVATRSVLSPSSLLGVVVSALLYLVLVFLSGAVRASDVAMLLRRKPAPIPRPEPALSLEI